MSNQAIAIYGALGAGKTSLAKGIRVNCGIDLGSFVSVQGIKRLKCCTDEEALEIAKTTHEYCLETGANFSFEFDGSNVYNMELLKAIKKKHYKLTGFALVTTHPNINKARIKKRSELGGDAIEDAIVEKSFESSMKHFPYLISQCDHLYVYDNTPNSESEDYNDYQPILRCNHQIIEIMPNSIWTYDMIFKLIRGEYAPDT